MKKLALVFLIGFSQLAAFSCRSTSPTPEETSAIAERLHRTNVRAGHWNAVVQLYEHRAFRPIWIAHGKPLPERINALNATLNQAPQHALESQDYVTSPMADPVDYELELTSRLVQFGFDVAGNHDFIEPRLSEAIDHDALPGVVEKLAPKHIEYRDLMRGLQNYQGDAEGFRQIQLNMQRLRELPPDLGARYIRVNVPEYRLAVVDNGVETLSMNVVVGKTDTPTPIFSSNMTHIVFSPYWNIPESILTKETLPKALKDRNYLARQNIEIVRVSNGAREVVDPSDVDWSEIGATSAYRFRQRPGGNNSLGLVKFMLPNKFDVYLHDTPADNLFKLDDRDFSHGCIRIEQPLALAKYLLSDQENWTEGRINAAMHSGDEQTVKLREPIPVHIMYLTAWGDAQGEVHFGKDVYGLDKETD